MLSATPATREDLLQRAARLVRIGHWLNPMQAAETTSKFEMYALPVYGPERTRALLERWWAVAELATLSEALDLLDRP